MLIDREGKETTIDDSVNHAVPGTLNQFDVDNSLSTQWLQRSEGDWVEEEEFKMGITIEQAMHIGGLRHCKIAAGHEGAERIVQHVAVMEVPDTIRWLKGNDFLLSSLFSVKDDPEALEQLVPQLIEKNCAGLAIKTYHALEEGIPAIILEQANAYQFPIIEIKNEVSYLDIMTPLMAGILTNNSPRSEQVEDYYKWVSELAFNGESLDIILDTLKKIMTNHVTLESEIPFIKYNHDDLIASFSREQRNEFLKARRPIKTKRELNGKKVNCIVAPLILNQEINGFLTCWETESELTSFHLILLERVIPLIALEFLKVKTKIEVEQKYRNEFLREIVSGNIKMEEAIEKGKFYNWNFNESYEVIILAIDHFMRVVKRLDHNELFIQEYKLKILRIMENLMRIKMSSAIVGMTSNYFIILKPAKKHIHLAENKKDMIQATKKFITNIIAELKRQVPEVTFTSGIGRFHSGFCGISIGYKDAIKTIEIGKEIFGRRTVLHFDDLGIYRMLSQLESNEELTTVYHDTIKKLVTYDENSGANLVETLKVYFEHDCSLKDTAELLYIHVNTIKYRLKKIKELTEYDVFRTEDKFYLQLGLKVARLLAK
ncbi:PucR family transcriptional regulator [Halalkalibacter oceani]|uniref:PucR family transcriptional regulator n=1 Tax=Halalkalibacter oceani TaxID=1653776 RepID=UPI003394CA9C